jgi:hypothetical protein
MGVSEMWAQGQVGQEDWWQRLRRLLKEERMLVISNRKRVFLPPGVELQDHGKAWHFYLY